MPDPAPRPPNPFWVLLCALSLVWEALAFVATWFLVSTVLVIVAIVAVFAGRARLREALHAWRDTAGNVLGSLLDERLSAIQRALRGDAR
jgi:hypothetical protein